MQNLTALLWTLIWIGAAALAAILVVLFLVRLLRRRQADDATGGPFTLSQVVALRDSGQLNQAEYLQLRSIVLSKLPERPNFTLHELRLMRQRGEVSEQEYEMVRAIMIARLRESESDGAS